MSKMGQSANAQEEINMQQEFQYVLKLIKVCQQIENNQRLENIDKAINRLEKSVKELNLEMRTMRDDGMIDIISKNQEIMDRSKEGQAQMKEIWDVFQAERAKDLPNQP
ncbi:hypothetical protein FGO68_gene13281 [Halteria grandinella]|uniref:Uncharacterized protein n=1 Tax=Halteria grandinella TaxID=5974 RepID=A0A8J8NBD7_HALGN|nr:hypothetical protein FGO68_gene13281 [Halteria grandinella]